MLSLITANVRRRSERTLLTAAGIAVGVAAVVALLGRAVLIGTVIGTVGSLYPIWRVTRMRTSAPALS